MGIAREELNKTDVSIVSVSSGCELFMRFITLAHSALEDASDFAFCRKILIERGDEFIKRMQLSREKIVTNSKRLIKDGMTILTHSYSRNVLAVMKDAAERGIKFKVLVTQSQPDCSGEQMASELRSNKIDCTVILDGAVGYIIEKIDCVMVGAEGVCENGGVINKIGTCTIATLAHLKNKSFYVLVESFKFLRTIPLNNSSLPKFYLYRTSVLNSSRDLYAEHPLVDYTHPDYITLLYTDYGALPTSAVTEHLIKLYT